MEITSDLKPAWPHSPLQGSEQPCMASAPHEAWVWVLRTAAGTLTTLAILQQGKPEGNFGACGSPHSSHVSSHLKQLN